VAVELPALALVHTAWVTALVFGTLNLLLLRTRIRVEEAALGRGEGEPAGAPAGEVVR
jgi:methyltransferase